MAFAVAPTTLRWSALIIILTTMMMGANANAPVSSQYNGKQNLEFFLVQCRVRATAYRVKELPLANVPQWRDVSAGDTVGAFGIRGARPVLLLDVVLV